MARRPLLSGVMNPSALQPLLAPRSIAVVGASESPDSWAPEIERSLRHVGFDGDLYPINPKYDEVWGRPCLGGIRELPRGVDLVVFVVPARVVVRMIDDCGAAGVRGIMVVSSGFAEAGDEGRALQEELRLAAVRTGIPVLGPNVEGFVNYVDRVAPYGTVPPPNPLPGPISVISQSGTVAWAMNQMASDRSVGLRIILGVGNEAVVGLGDMFAWAAADAKTTVVTSYIETMRDVDGIGRGLDALRDARKPILICAPEGRSEAARRSIVAHTGALAGDTAMRDAWLKGHGVVLVDDPVTMFEAAVLLCHARKVRTPGVAAALQSGGACTLFAEAAGGQGLTMPEFSTKTKRRLKRTLPHYASQNNPLDVTGQAAVETGMFCDALDALANDPGVGVVVFDAFPPRLPGEEPWAGPVLRKVQELRRSTGVVFVSVAMSPLAYAAEAASFVRRWRLPVPPGSPGGDRRDTRADRPPRVPGPAGDDACGASEPSEGSPVAPGGRRPIGRGEGREAPHLVRGRPAERGHGSNTGPSRRGGAVARVPGRREGPGTRGAAQGPAGRRPAGSHGCRRC